jgi:hypothetical protein
MLWYLCVMARFVGLLQTHVSSSPLSAVSFCPHVFMIIWGVGSCALAFRMPIAVNLPMISIAIWSFFVVVVLLVVVVVVVVVVVGLCGDQHNSVNTVFNRRGP